MYLYNIFKILRFPFCRLLQYSAEYSCILCRLVNVSVKDMKSFSIYSLDQRNASFNTFTKKQSFYLNTFTVSRGCPTITLDAPVTNTNGAHFKYVANEVCR